MQGIHKDPESSSENTTSSEDHKVKASIYSIDLTTKADNH